MSTLDSTAALKKLTKRLCEDENKAEDRFTKLEHGLQEQNVKRVKLINEQKAALYKQLLLSAEKKFINKLEDKVKRNVYDAFEIYERASSGKSNIFGIITKHI